MAAQARSSECSSVAGLIGKNHFEYDQVIIERDEAAEERQRDEPEQAIIRTGPQRDAKQVELSEKSSERR